MEHDLVIRGGTVYDGSGADGVTADVAVDVGGAQEARAGVGEGVAGPDAGDARRHRQVGGGLEQE